VDVDANRFKTSRNQRFTAAEKALASARGRSVDAARRRYRPQGEEKR
jgi:hypothetical protein